MHEIYPQVMDFPAYWCDCFVDWCFYKAYGISNAKALLGGNFDDYTKNSINLYKNKNAFFLRGTKTPKEGDQVFFSTDNTYNGVNHTGYVYDYKNGKIYVVEGNASCNSTTNNGGGVVKKEYDINNCRIYGYGRPNYALYDKDEPTITDVSISCDKTGLKIIGTECLNIRKWPGDGAIVGTYKKNEKIQICAKALNSDNTWWFKTNKGYISGKYVEGWIKESCGKWWYIKLSYTFDTNKVVKINNKYYAFDKDGWLITADRISSDGAIKDI